MFWIALRFFKDFPPHYPGNKAFNNPCPLSSTHSPYPSPLIPHPHPSFHLTTQATKHSTILALSRPPTPLIPRPSSRTHILPSTSLPRQQSIQQTLPSLFHPLPLSLTPHPAPASFLPPHYPGSKAFNNPCPLSSTHSPHPSPSSPCSFLHILHHPPLSTHLCQHSRGRHLHDQAANPSTNTALSPPLLLPPLIFPHHPHAPSSISSIIPLSAFISASMPGEGTSSRVTCNHNHSSPSSTSHYPHSHPSPSSLCSPPISSIIPLSAFISASMPGEGTSMIRLLCPLTLLLPSLIGPPRPHAPPPYPPSSPSLVPLLSPHILHHPPPSSLCSPPISSSPSLVPMLPPHILHHPPLSIHLRQHARGRHLNLLCHQLPLVHASPPNRGARRVINPGSDPHSVTGGAPGSAMFGMFTAGLAPRNAVSVIAAVVSVVAIAPAGTIADRIIS
ncbi:unnamed protein product [Closterium sp. Naga37s-1]|nr:unnamed protein product [Closterium sp. Naga37s-1]